MRNIIIVLICLSVLGFVLAVIASLPGYNGPVVSEAFSRACTNLALIAIALSVSAKDKSVEN